MIQQLTPDLAEAFGAKGEKGMLVNRVVPGSPAARGGVRMGDILVAWGKARISGVKEFRALVAGTVPGESIPIEVLRDGKRFLVTVSVVEAEGKAQVRRPPLRQSVDPLGMTVSSVHPRILRELELRGGVEVTFVEASSPAWDGGVREGDILLTINRETVNDIDAYRKVVARLPKGSVVSALVSREGELLFVALRSK